MDFPLQARLQDCVVPQRGESRLPGQAELDFAIHFDHRFGSARSRVIARSEDFRRNGAVGFLRFAHGEVDRLPLEKREQIGLGERVVAVVLLEDLEWLTGFVAKHHGIRLELERCAIVADFINTLTELKWQDVADNREILIVNRQPRRSAGRHRNQG